MRKTYAAAPARLSTVLVPLVSLVVGLATVAGLVGPAAPAAAGVRPNPTVTLVASADAVPVGSVVRLSGKVTGPSVGAKVRLDKRVGQRWSVVASTKVKQGRKFVLRVAAGPGDNAYRVTVSGTKRIRPATSRVVVVRGLADEPQAPGESGEPGEPEEPETGPWTAAEVRAIVLRDTNVFRAANGLPPLQPMPELDTVATSWARWMAEHDTFEHNPVFGEQYPPGWRRAGENIAAGYDPSTVVRGWIDSPGHRANMLGDYTHLGLGYAHDPASTYGMYFVQNFARY